MDPRLSSDSRHDLNGSHDSGHDSSQDRDSADPGEGINAFLEKRLPTFVEKVSDGFPELAARNESFD